MLVQKHTTMNAVCRQEERQTACISSDETTKVVPASVETTLSLPPSMPKRNNVASRSVSFDSVEIREYDRVVDVNPSVTSGVAVGIGWNYELGLVCDLEEFESMRPPRRSKVEFQLPAKTRERMLREEAGYSKAELMQALRQINFSKTRRRASIAAQEVEFAHVVMESAVRKLKRFVKRTNKHKEQEKLWIDAHKKALKEEAKRLEISEGSTVSEATLGEMDGFDISNRKESISAQ